MFLQDFAYVDLPRDTVRRQLTGHSAEWLTTIAARAAFEGEALWSDVEVAASGAAIGAAVSVGQPLDLGDVTIVPLAWQAAPGATTLATADLELASMGAARTQLTLLGRAAETRKPGPFHRGIIQATMRAFLFHLAHDLEEGAATARVAMVARRLPLAG